MNRDLVMAAYHEAAHLVIARRYGVLAHMRIGPREDAGADEKGYWGQTYMLTVPAAGRLAIGLAGVIAEFLFEDPQEESFEIAHQFELLGAPSESDLELAGVRDISDIDPTELEAVVDEVKSAWQEIATAAECAIAAEA